MSAPDQSIGERFARAVGTGDRAALVALLDPHVEFRAVTPRRAWEAHSPDEVAGIVFGTWFDGGVDAIEHVEHGTVGDCTRVGYRFRSSRHGTAEVVEQQAYLTVGAGRITALRIACSGFRPAGVSPG